ncbi:MAG: sodium:solute symporter family protein [Candidatus Pacebacteria bacterium]|nr:sodium:solute symporter family protein [Candidatus Paceibacterota bacterium]
MLFAISVLGYAVVMILIGVYAARKVKTSEDYVLAGRSLPFYMALSTVFATWFGSESILGAGSKFAEGGFSNVVEDPFGAALCLIIAGLFFNRKLYRLNFLTIGDYFKYRYNTLISTFLSGVIIVSYFGWVAAQFLALGVLLHTVLPVLSISAWVIISALVVSVYTVMGGMISVALHDTVQSVIILVGLGAVLASVLHLVGGVEGFMQIIPEGHLQVLPKEHTMLAWVAFFTALMTQGFGSIPQQDIYQRAMSARNEKESMWASVLGGILYFVVVMLPISIAMIAAHIYPQLLATDSQLLIPTLIKENTNTFLQILFFGALISAILSTASGALLAPATLLAENIVKPFFKEMGDRMRMRIIQTGVGIVALGAIMLAYNPDAQIYELVAGAYSVTLVAGFAPLAFGLYTKWVNSFGAFFSITSGVMFWQAAEKAGTDFPPTFIGFCASVLAIIIGSYIGNLIEKNKETPQ